LTGEPAALDEAVRGYDRGFYLRDDYYNGTNLAYMLNVRALAAMRRAVMSSPSIANTLRGRSVADHIALRAESVADFVQAARVRREVLAICESVLERESLSADDRYWALAATAEAYVGLGDEERARQRLEEAYATASARWMKESTKEQLDKLRQLLAESPLRYIEAGVGVAAA
jgi:hypothetical protein